MEILRFEEATTAAPKRNKSSKGYLTLGFVAALFSVGSAFATTTSSININNRESISIGQGITAFTTCDEFIAVLPVTKLNETATDFVLDKITIGAEYAGDTKYKINNSNKSDPLSPGCGGVDFKITFYKGVDVADVCNANGLVYGVASGIPTSVVDLSNGSKCESNSIFFKVYAADTYDIQFDDTKGTSFFDRISLETVPTINY
jgi:hypothetical protein